MISSSHRPRTPSHTDRHYTYTYVPTSRSGPKLGGVYVTKWREMDYTRGDIIMVHDTPPYLGPRSTGYSACCALRWTAKKLKPALIPLHVRVWPSGFSSPFLLPLPSFTLVFFFLVDIPRRAPVPGFTCGSSIVIKFQ